MSGLFSFLSQVPPAALRKPTHLIFSACGPQCFGRTGFGNTMAVAYAWPVPVVLVEVEGCPLETEANEVALEPSAKADEMEVPLASLPVVDTLDWETATVVVELWAITGTVSAINAIATKIDLNIFLALPI